MMPVSKNLIFMRGSYTAVHWPMDVGVDLKSKGPCRDSPSQRPPVLQHETPRKSFLSSRKLCLAKDLYSDIVEVYFVEVVVYYLFFEV
jgi:hypothetical protein